MSILDRIAGFPGDVGFYMKRLSGGEALCFQPDRPLVAASVIKVPVMVAAFREIAAGRLDENEICEIAAGDKVPSCGALTYMHDGLRVTLMDLITLMIILSDNTATNRVIDIVGIPTVNAAMGELGIPGIDLQRKMFDAAMAAKGYTNTVTARGIGILLERLAKNALLGAPWDGRMLNILLDQRLNGKLPFFLHPAGIDVAHKTGEDEGTTHDAGIVFSADPFVIVMLSNNVNVPAFERLIQDAAAELAGVDTV